MSSENEIKGILKSYLDGSITEQEQKTLREWIEQSQENRELFDLMEESSDYIPLLGKVYKYNEDRVWNNIRRTAHKERKRRLLLSTRKYAAVFGAALVVIGCGWLLYAEQTEDNANQAYIEQLSPGMRGAVLTLSSGESVALDKGGQRMLVERNGVHVKIDNDGLEYHIESPDKQAIVATNTIVVPRGKEYSFILSDGTQVWLNSESSIVFPVAFSSTSREVTICGEVFFDVAEDKSKRFIVHTDSISISVYGTAFNISAYREDGVIETTLLRGSVEVAINDRKTMLRPGMQARVEKNGVFDVREVIAEDYAGWKEGLFSFDNESLESICRKLSRWYNVEITPQGDAALNMRYTGVVKRYESFGGMSRLLERTGQIKTDVNDGKIMLYIDN